MRTPNVVTHMFVFVSVGVLAGCASSSRVPVTATHSQTESQQVRDRSDCAAGAATATTRRAGDVHYAACMAARGYQ